MPSTLSLRAVLAAALMCLASAAGAQTPGMTPGMPGMAPGMMPGAVPGQPQTVLLDEEIVARFIESYPAIQSELDVIEEQYDLPKSQGGSPVEAMQGLAAYQQVTGALNGIVNQHGFGTYGEWVLTASAIAMAHAFASEGGNMDDQMAATIAQVQADTTMSEAQKQMVLQQLQLQNQMMAGMRPPQQNIDAVSNYAAEIDTLFDNN